MTRFIKINMEQTYRGKVCAYEKDIPIFDGDTIKVPVDIWIDTKDSGLVGALSNLIAAAETSLDYRHEFRLAIANAHAAVAKATGRDRAPTPYEQTESEGGEL